jgi:hypothetical protein
MMPDLLIDNDVLIKCSCYSVLDQLRGPSDRPRDVAVLGAARFVVGRYLERHGIIHNRSAAQRHFQQYLSTVIVLEPTVEELSLASEIEEKALLLGLDLDSGESQLCAIAIFRGPSLLLTGDKRAIAGAERLRANIGEMSLLEGRLVCLEQAIMGVAERIGISTIRVQICAEAAVDKSLSICFECHTLAEGRPLEQTGLLSYIRDLRGKAPALLYEADSL